MKEIVFPGADKHLSGWVLPEKAVPVGYAALILAFNLKVPTPVTLSAISNRHRKYTKNGWSILTPRHMPESTLYGHLTFALKYEGINLILLKSLFRITGPSPITRIVRDIPGSSYARRLWFLYEWLTDEELDLPDSTTKGGNYAPVVDTALQYTVPGISSPRHRVKNNLPGTREFCPLVFRTERLENYRNTDLPAKATKVIGGIPDDVLAKAAAFLLLNDSRASFAIEGEQASLNRIQRWGQAISESGNISLSHQELVRLQRIVIGDFRFVQEGFRSAGGFIGEHDRHTGFPLPVHISARAKDINPLLDGLIAFDRQFAPELDAVVAAAVLAFGFIYIHPFEDGNGRIHRLLIHHMLTKMGYNPPELIFPISSAILENIKEYRATLENYSSRLLPLIEWEPTKNGNVKVINDTADFYRYFDATAHTEFLYHCVENTIKTILPEEVQYLQNYDMFRSGIGRILEMSSGKIELLHKFLQQNCGRLSSRAKMREFAALTQNEISEIENLYKSSFLKKEDQ
ncbi:MAG: Fic family protein [Candidatus Sabulitectum sp.]|nr:Fic family protein [Candidatus Sabulitectum sp.]